MGRPKSFIKKKPGFEYRFNRGVKLIRDMLAQTGRDDNMRIIMEKFAETALVEAVKYYDESNTGNHNLTGNTRFSFCAGIYKDGDIIDSVKVLSLVNGKHTFHQVNVGDKGFMDYDRDEYVLGVKEYSDPSRSFVKVGDNDFSYLQTMQWLKEKHPSNSKGYSVIVASVSPYVEYIHQWLALDILDSSSANIRSDLDKAIREAKLNK